MIEFIIALLIVGAALYLLQLVPIDGTIKRVIQVLVILAVVPRLFVLAAIALAGVIAFGVGTDLWEAW